MTPPIASPAYPGVGLKTTGALLARHGAFDALYAALPLLPTRQADLPCVYKSGSTSNRRLVPIVTTMDVSTGMEG